MNDKIKLSGPTSLTDRIAEGKKPKDEPNAKDQPAQEEPEAEQLFGSYSLVNASSRHQQVSLELRFLAGDSEAFSYSHCYKARLNRSGSIVLTFSDDVVTIKGTNLAPVFKGIKEHRVGYVAESDPRAETDDPKAAVIDSIKIDPRAEKEATP